MLAARIAPVVDERRALWRRALAGRGFEASLSRIGSVGTLARMLGSGSAVLGATLRAHDSEVRLVAVDGLLVPAGEAWRAAWRRDDSLALTLSDGFHPSLLGSVIAATSIWHALTGRSPVGLPSTIESERLERITMSAELALLVQEAVAEAQAEHGG